MRWNDLSIEAKSVIEWVENPYTKNRSSICIEVGHHFKRYCGSDGVVDILITDELYEEIKQFVQQDNNLEISKEIKEITFKIKDSSNLQLQLH